MNIRFAQGRMQLPRHQHLEVVDGRGTSMQCLLGSIWITQDGDPRDVVLAAGESFTVERNGVTIVYATADAEVSLSTRPAAPRLAG